MKKIILIVLVISTQISNAQWSTTGGLNTSTLSTGGSVGIGTNVPNSKLEVKDNAGNNSATFGGGVPLIRITGNTPTFSEPAIAFQEQTNPPIAQISAKNVNSGAGHLIFQTRNIGQQTLSEKMRILDNGNVGIGLSNPGAPLDVRSSSPTNFSTIAKFSRNGASGFGMGIFHGLSQGSYNGIVGNGDFGLIFDVDGQPTTISNSGFVIAPWQNNTAGIKILENGKVFIGNVTTTPGNYSLYVEKGILTEMVRVALKNSAQWADYVFHKDYKLKSLKEVEDFIQENNHLPNVPSSEEIVKDGGIDVSSMMVKQMEKIEELTLYIIKQQKEIDEMKSILIKLQSK